MLVSVGLIARKQLAEMLTALRRQIIDGPIRQEFRENDIAPPGLIPERVAFLEQANFLLSE